MSISTILIIFLVFTNIATFVVMNRQVEKYKERAEFEALRAISAKRTLTDGIVNVHRAHEKLLQKAGVEFRRRLDEEKKRLREEFEREYSTQPKARI